MRKLLRAAVLVVACTATLVACGGGSSDDPAVTGPVDQAVERLRDYGLSAAQARCVVDEVGASTVVEASELTAFVDSQQYRDAADRCITDG